MICETPHPNQATLEECDALRQRVALLEGENAALAQENAGLKAQNRLAQQNAEALGAENRYFANAYYMRTLGRLPVDWELFVYYVENGGKLHFDQVHPPR